MAASPQYKGRRGRRRWLGPTTSAGCVEGLRRFAQGATALWAEGGGIALGHTFGVRVLKIDRPDGRRVLKFDGPSGRGLWYRPYGR